MNSSKLTKSEEDYLKTLFHLTVDDGLREVGNNHLAQELGVSPASANNMVKKLKGKGFLLSEKYGKVQLSADGKNRAVALIRKHRLWETFLYRTMNFSWDEVHEVAEQLEHIKSSKLIDELERFLDFPKTDPHGEPIPHKNGSYQPRKSLLLSNLVAGSKCRITAVKDNSVSFLQYVSALGLVLSSELEVLEVRDFDKSLKLSFDGRTETVTKEFADRVFVMLL